MADTTIAVTPGAGSNIRLFSNGSAQLDQYIRQAMATAVTLNSWTVTTGGQASQIGADVTRVGLLITSAATGIVYLRFDSTIPVPATPAYHWLLNPGDRWEVPQQFCQLAVSMAGAVAGGTVLSALGTAA